MKTKSKKNWYYRLSFRRRQNLWGIIFLAPWIIGFLIFFLKPLFNSVIYSLNDITITGTGLIFKFSGLKNFTDALSVNPTFKKELLTAIAEVAINTPILLLVSLFVAILLNGDYKGRSVARVIFFIPIILATGLTSMKMGGTNLVSVDETKESIINMQFLVNFFVQSGFPQQLIQYLFTAVNTVFETVANAGIQMLIFLAGLQAISPSLYEVAHIEGATTYETFCKVTLPMVSPMILICLIYSITDLFYRSKITQTIYDIAFSESRYGLSAAMSVIYLIANILFIGIVAWLVSRKVFYYDK